MKCKRFVHLTPILLTCSQSHVSSGVSRVPGQGSGRRPRSPSNAPVFRPCRARLAAHAQMLFKALAKWLKCCVVSADGQQWLLVSTYNVKTRCLLAVSRYEDKMKRGVGQCDKTLQINVLKSNRTKRWVLMVRTCYEGAGKPHATAAGVSLTHDRFDRATSATDSKIPPSNLMC